MMTNVARRKVIVTFALMGAAVDTFYGARLARAFVDPASDRAHTDTVRPDGVVCAETGNDYLYLTHANFETPLGAMFLAAPVAAEMIRFYLSGEQAGEDSLGADAQRSADTEAEGEN